MSKTFAADVEAAWGWVEGKFSPSVRLRFDALGRIGEMQALTSAASVTPRQATQLLLPGLAALCVRRAFFCEQETQQLTTQSAQSAMQALARSGVTCAAVEQPLRWDADAVSEATAAAKALVQATLAVGYRLGYLGLFDLAAFAQAREAPCAPNGSPSASGALETMVAAFEGAVYTLADKQTGLCGWALKARVDPRDASQRASLVALRTRLAHLPLTIELVCEAPEDLSLALYELERTRVLDAGVSVLVAPHRLAPYQAASLAREGACWVLPLEGELETLHADRMMAARAGLDVVLAAAPDDPTRFLPQLWALVRHALPASSSVLLGWEPWMAAATWHVARAQGTTAGRLLPSGPGDAVYIEMDGGPARAISELACDSATLSAPRMRRVKTFVQGRRLA